MVGLICVGLLGLAGVIFVISTNEAQEAAVVPPTATVLLPTFTPTPTASATPTETPLPTPTGTPVISDNFGEEPPPEVEEVDEGEVVEVTPVVEEEPTLEPGVTATNTLVLQTPTVTDTPVAATPEAGMPGSGAALVVDDHNFLAWAGLSLLLLLLMGAIRRFR